VPQPSELLINPATDELLKEIYPEFDYIIIDSSPLLAADDTASLAPKIDAVLFVVRLAFTPAKMTRKALEILEKRQANIPGLILNFVDTKSPEFVYYQYPEYYHSPVDERKAPAKVG
jgi:succinoglycan biosynthesis transport protein ExoP